MNPLSAAGGAVGVYLALRGIWRHRPKPTPIKEVLESREMWELRTRVSSVERGLEEIMDHLHLMASQWGKQYAERDMYGR